MQIIAERHKALAEMDRELRGMKGEGGTTFQDEVVLTATEARRLMQSLVEEMVVEKPKPKVKKQKRKRTPWR